MFYVVTGAAGFIGSHLCRALLEDGHDVLGIDCLTDYYDVAVKRHRVAELARHRRYRHSAADLVRADLAPLLAGADTVFHLAGQPGVRLSWADYFDVYVERNLLASHRILEALRDRPQTRIVVASSSSVYGNAPAYPTTEDSPTLPFSPYGVTKLAMEHLCWSYVDNFGLDVVALRYFTVYGPGQRPDMALHRFIRSAIAGTPIELYGDGEQRRDFTYVGDIVRATAAAATRPVPSGTVLNVSGGAQASVNEVLDLVAEQTGRRLHIQRLPAQPGDVRETGAVVDRVSALLDWRPETGLADGIAAQAAQVLGVAAAGVPA